MPDENNPMMEELVRAGEDAFLHELVCQITVNSINAQNAIERYSVADASYSLAFSNDNLDRLLRLAEEERQNDYTRRVNMAINWFRPFLEQISFSIDMLKQHPNDGYASNGESVKSLSSISCSTAFSTMSEGVEVN